MTMDEIREVAALIGIMSAHKFAAKGDLIKTIQLEMGLEDCFRANTPATCKRRVKCLWKDDCEGRNDS